MNMRKISAAIFFATFIFLGSLFPLKMIHAEGAQGGLKISPALQEIVLDEKGGEKDFFVTLTNDTENLVTLQISEFDFGSLDESGGVAFLGASSDLEKKYALASWMRPEKDTLTLNPAETGQVRVTIENRDSLSPGGHYGALTFKSIPSDDTTGTNTLSVNQLFSTLVFVKKVGGEIYGLKLGDIEYKAGLVQWQNTLPLRFQNTGNVHVIPRGRAIITDPLGRTVSKGIINEESSLILPETLRTYPVPLKKLAMSFMPGRYTLDIAYRYDGKDDFVSVSKRFLFFPLPTIVSIIILVILIGWIVIFFRRKRRQ